jgi:hypothetical protein
LSCAEHVVDRYEQPKALWEVIAEPAAMDPPDRPL